MKKVITYGTFDLLHEGHIRLLERARALGDYLIVGVTTDNFDVQRGKLNTCNNVMDRIEAVRKTGLADQIVLEEYRGQKIDDIQKYGVDIFAIGSDWEGHFDYLKDYCNVVYLPRTEGISSTMLRERRETVRIGIIGTGSIASRFVPEASFVNNTEITAAYNPDSGQCRDFCDSFGIPLAASSPDELLEACSAVYIASPYHTHYEYAKRSLLAGKHVLCETPFVLRESEARELYGIAREKNLCLMAALKTAFCPAFGHLVTLLRSGAIGDIVEVNASVTTLTDDSSSRQMGGSMVENACFPLLPIFKLLGTSYEDMVFYSRMKNGVDMFTKTLVRYPHAIASFQVGLGVKTEGCMTVAGTKGYAYVPAPWWKTDYFEMRYEDQNLNKKYFYPYDGAGLRYEIKDFVTAVIDGYTPSFRLTADDNISMAAVMERFIGGDKVTAL